MNGTHRSSQATAHMVVNSTPHMPSTATEEHFQWSATIASTTWQPNFSPKCAQVLRLNHTFNPYSEKLCHRTTNLEDNARLDVKALGFWGNERQCAFFDVRVFNPFAPSHASQTIQSTYRKNEKEKRRQYEKWITNLEHGCFTLLVMLGTGRLGPSAGVFCNRLACIIRQKHLSPYCETMKLIQCKLAFSLVDLAGLCLRIARSVLHRPARLNLNTTPVDMIVSEGCLWTHFCFQWQMHLLTPELCNLMCLDIFATCMCFVCVICCQFLQQL